MKSIAPLLIPLIAWGCGSGAPQARKAPANTAACAPDAGCTPNVNAVGPVAFMGSTQMRELRKLAWNLLPLVGAQHNGPPDPSVWVTANEAFPETDPARAPHAIFEIAAELENTKLAPVVQRPYQSVFFNRTAYDFIRSQELYLPATAARLLRQNIRELSFPAESMAMKMFWRVVPQSRRIDVNLWDWKKVPAGIEPITQDTVCVEIEPARGSRCVKAAEQFYTLQVSDPRLFDPDSSGNRPKQGDLLILVALHIASKQMPDWLWATFWWRGDDSQNPTGDSWTCADAQRDLIAARLRAMPRVWTHYSMDTTASFTLGKPDSDPGCGVPGMIGDNEQRLAVYNPFVEATLKNGRKSSCISCHARADTNRMDKPMCVPNVGFPDPSLLLQNFEGHIRTDYLWSVQRGLGTTSAAYGGTIPWPPHL